MRILLYKKQIKIRNKLVATSPNWNLKNLKQLPFYTGKVLQWCLDRGVDLGTTQIQDTLKKELQTGTDSITHLLMEKWNPPNKEN